MTKNSVFVLYISETMHHMMVIYGILISSCFSSSSVNGRNKFWVVLHRFYRCVILILQTISGKICETHTISFIIQCWLQVCLFLPGHHCLNSFFRLDTTMTQETGALLGIFKQVKYFCGTFFMKIKRISIIFVADSR